MIAQVLLAGLAVAAVAFRLGHRSAWLAGYRDALADVDATDRHVGWVRAVGAADQSGVTPLTRGRRNLNLTRRTG